MRVRSIMDQQQTTTTSTAASRNEQERSEWMREMMETPIQHVHNPVQRTIYEGLKLQLSETHEAKLYEQFNGNVRIKLIRNDSLNKRVKGENYRELYMTLSQFIVLQTNYGLITDKLKAVSKAKTHYNKPSFELHLGGKIFITITPPFKTVDIRYRFMELNEDPVHTRFGVNLDEDEWDMFGEFVDETTQLVIDYHTYDACIYTHNSMEEVRTCGECKWGTLNRDNQRHQWTVTTYPPPENRESDNDEIAPGKTERAEQKKRGLSGDDDDDVEKKRSRWAVTEMVESEQGIKMKLTKEPEQPITEQTCSEQDSTELVIVDDEPAEQPDDIKDHSEITMANQIQSQDDCSADLLV
jgi:hypothetical protein